MTLDPPTAPSRLSVTSLAHDGRGIGFLPGAGTKGKAVFVPGALPGQIISCRLARNKKNFAEAELLEILEDLPDRQPPPCSNYDKCGGCPLQPLPYARQLEWKNRLALETMRRIGRLDGNPGLVWHPPVPSPRLYSFRNKIEFAFADSLSLGFRQRQSHKVIPTRDCALVDPIANQIAITCGRLAAISRLNAYIPGKGGFWRFLILRKGLPTGNSRASWHALCVTSPASDREKKLARDLGEALMASEPALASFTHEERCRADTLAIGEKRIFSLQANGDNQLVMRKRLLDKTFLLDPASFFQVNDAAAEELARVILAMAKGGDHLLDLYCGVGAPGLLLAPAFAHVWGVERDTRSINFARRNAAAFDLENTDYQAGDAGIFLKKYHASGKKCDLALLDPPRAGLSPLALQSLLAIGPKRILYISCNPATLARDAALISRTHNLEEFATVDLFPHTPHIECCAMWHNRGENS